MEAIEATPRVESATGAGADLARLVGRGSTLAERRAAPGLRFGNDADPAAVDAWAGKWAGEFVRLGADAFQRRLSWDGLDRGELGTLLADAALADAAALPEWARVFCEIYGRDADELKDRFARLPPEDRALDPADPAAFEALFIPVLDYARRALRSEVGGHLDLLAPEAQAELERELLLKVVGLTQRALFASFTVRRLYHQRQALTAVFGAVSGRPDALFRAFVDEMRGGGLFAFWVEYGVAARLVAVAVSHWVEVVGEFAERVARDRTDLERVFGGGRAAGRVAHVRASMGDTHEGGRAVMIAEFESGLKVVYKPRPIPLEIFYADLVEWWNSVRGDLPDLRAAAALDRETHGWIEFVDHHPCEDLEAVGRFYERSGIVLALVHALNGNDYHLENLISAADHPVLIDHEALMTPRCVFTDENGVANEQFQHVADSIARSVAGTGLLPLLKEVGKGTRALDLGGLSTEGTPDMKVQVVKWRHMNTDLMKMSWEEMPPLTAENVPRLGEEPQFARDHVDGIVRGFERCYRLLLARRAEISARVERLRGVPVRFLFRHTHLYAMLLQRCLHPRFLTDGRERAFQLDVLATALLGMRERPLAWPLVAAETQSLENLDIPLFSVPSDQRDLPLPGGEVVRDFFDRSAFDQALDKLAGLGEADLRRQKECILLAFRATQVRGIRPFRPRAAAPAVSREAGTEAEPVVLARRIAAAIEERAITGAGGSVWLGPQYQPRSGRHSLRPLGPSLFDGYPGFALLHAALGRITGDAQHAEAVRALLLDPSTGPIPEAAEGATPPRPAGLDLGIGTGLSGLIYALTVAGSLLDDEAFVREAEKYAGRIPDEWIDAEPGFDATTGVAGVLLAMLKLHDVTGSPVWLTRASRCADRLVGELSRKPAGAEPSRSEEPGIPHGGAGQALALLRLHAVAPDPRLVDAAAEALRRDQRAVAERWRPGVRAPEQTGWAAGTAGLGFAQLEAPEGSSARDGLGASLRQVEESLFDGSHDLANGVMGRIDLLLCAAEALGDAGLGTRARDAAGRALAEAAAGGGFDTGWGEGADHLGFFQGLSGIGYQLLRLQEPRLLPSVLAWR